MKSVISKRWYLFFLITFLLLNSYNMLRQILNTQYVIEFYLESLMLIFSLITVYAIINKHHYLANLLGVWPGIVLIIILICICFSVYFYCAYRDYATSVGFSAIYWWGTVFLASCLVFLGARKWIQRIWPEKSYNSIV